MREDKIEEWKRKVNWKKVVSREQTPLTVYSLVKGYDYASKIFSDEFLINNVAVVGKSLKTDYYLNHDEILSSAEMIKNKHPSFFLKIIKKTEDVCEDFNKTAVRLGKKDYSSLSNERLLSEFEEYEDKVLSYTPTLAVPFSVELVLAKRLKQGVRESFRISEDSQLEDLFRKATYSSEESDVITERKELLRLAVEVKKHAEKFGWMGCVGNSLLGEPWDCKKVLEMLSEISDPESELAQIGLGNKKSAAEAEKIEKKLGKKSKEDLRLLRKFMHLRAYRINALKKSQLAIRPLLKEIAHRFGLSYEEIIWFTEEEVRELLKKGKIPDFAPRRNKYGVIRMNGKTQMLPDMVIEDGVFESEKVIGQVAHRRGVIEGTAKIIFNAREIDKLREGDILISPMTVPDMVIAMKKAAAIVTDEGGILCHAAIVSRELEIPCIIGTGTATKTFKDGDRVRVDTERGIVEKIE